ncbi:MAG: hypothetical protein IPN26_02200 [Bacteroidetes bacterium]|nr:hypothetical protein [Bacteroidota bacterium]
MFITWILFSNELKAQYNLEFQHVGVETGLSYGVINNLCIDKRGKLWISTNRGVNVFNGYTIEKIMTEDYRSFETTLFRMSYAIVQIVSGYNLPMATSA